MHYRSIVRIAILMSVIALAAALISEYFFHLKPCILCIYQRIPYALIIGIGLLGMVLPKNGALMKAVIILIILLFVTNGGIAGYHTGVEKGIITMEVACDDAAAPVDSIEAMRAQLMGTNAVPCDKPQFVFLGLSMASWNMLYAFFCALAVSVLLVKRRAA